LKFPNFFKDRKARKLIEQLFNLVPEQRIGGSYAGLKSHPWFDNFDWDKLYNQEMKPPFIPPT
jgi:cGMP-dependent protein kinase